MKKLTMILALVAVVSLSGCLEEFDDGYQFGDLTRSVVAYCDEHSEDFIREIALEKIHEQYPGVPEDGICKYLGK